MRAKILSASAGSGKTYRLAYKFVHDVIKHYTSKPYLYRAILAVTFTNKATEEMKSRILKEIHSLIATPEQSGYMKRLQSELGLSQNEISQRAKAIQSSILHDYSRFTVLTIDKFFQRILRAFIKELGIDLNYNIELDTSTILTLSTDAMIEEMTIDEKLQTWIMEFAEECIDEGQRWDIRNKILSLGEELFKESNKQTILNSTSKEDLLQIIRHADKRSMQAKTECQKLGTKAMEIINDSGLDAVCFFGKNQKNGLIQFFSRAAEAEPIIPSDKLKLRITNLKNWTASDVSKQVKIQVGELAVQLQPILSDLCSICDKNQKLWCSLPFIKATFRSYALLQDIYQKVQQQCEQEGVMLLPETKYILSRFVAGNDAPFIYEKIGNRFERYMIDEFQDTSAKEWENFVPLLKNAMSQSEDSPILIVGDVKQSIYRWRGGDWRILNSGVESDLGSDNIDVEIMSNNYRSLKQIVEFNNMAVERVVAKDNAQLNIQLQEAAEEQKLSKEAQLELTDTLISAYNDHAQTPQIKSEQQGYVRVERFDSTCEPPLVKCIESIIKRGYSYKDILILCRDKKDGEKAANILLEYKRRNNSFNIMTQDSLIISRSPISQFVIAVLRLSQNIKDSISCAMMNDYLGRKYSEPLQEEDIALLSRISQLTPEEAFEHIVAHYSLCDNKQEIAYLQALHEQIISFNTSKVADIQLFLKMWDDKGSEKSLSVEKSDNTIELMTIHKAKGLEKKVVIIPYCSWGLNPRPNNFVWATPDTQADDVARIGRFPINYKTDMENSIFSDDYFREKVYSHVDGINLLYVALTRAKEELYAFIPSNAKENTIGKLFWSVLSDSAVTDEETGNEIVEFGVPINCDADNSNELSLATNILFNEYPTTLAKMRLSLPQQRYYEESNKLSARDMGILMHSILSEATDLASIKERITAAYKAGKLDQSQSSELLTSIEREFEKELVRSWFGKWDEIRNENDIIGSHIIGTRRPDRVMIKGDKAVVVDYKFGAEKLKAHQKQIANYMGLLSQMGYSEIEGYIWYLSMGEIVKVEE